MINEIDKMEQELKDFNIRLEKISKRISKIPITRVQNYLAKKYYNPLSLKRDECFTMLREITRREFPERFIGYGY